MHWEAKRIHELKLGECFYLEASTECDALVVIGHYTERGKLLKLRVLNLSNGQSWNVLRSEAWVWKYPPPANTIVNEC